MVERLLLEMESLESLGVEMLMNARRWMRSQSKCRKRREENQGLSPESLTSVVS